MTYDEVKNLKVSNVVASTDLKDLAKECLSITKGSTLKNNEIIMLINAAVLDIERQGIDVENHIQDGIIQGAIIMFVKSNFGMVDIKEKEVSQKAYINICNNLSLSSDYKKR